LPLTEAATWQVMLDPAGRSGAANMAIDAELLADAAASGRAVLRLYRFAPPCLSLGRNEPAARYDRAAIARLGIDVVRRPTGGRAVWHEHDVTYAVAAPIAAFGGLRAAYHAIHARIAAALRALGANVTLAFDRPSARAPGRSGACFATAVGGEVIAAGRKLVGSAQVRRGAALLQHGSILVAGSQNIVDVISRQSSLLVSGATTLSEVLGRPVSFDEVASAIVDAWWDTVSRTPRPPDRLTAAFRDPAWLWRR
jgi:lipoate-protein ligase A